MNDFSIPGAELSQRMRAIISPSDFEMSHMRGGSNHSLQ